MATQAEVEALVEECAQAEADVQTAKARLRDLRARCAVALRENDPALLEAKGEVDVVVAGRVVRVRLSEPAEVVSISPAPATYRHDPEAVGVIRADRLMQTTVVVEAPAEQNVVDLTLAVKGLTTIIEERCPACTGRVNALSNRVFLLSLAVISLFGGLAVAVIGYAVLRRG